MPPNDRRKPPRPKLGLIVRDGQCRTCIYRPGSPLDLKKLEAEVANPYDRNTFDTYRACHEFRGRTVVCAGFWKHHGARCQIGQIAHRLRRVYTVDINGGVTLRARNEHPPGTAGPPTTPDARPLDTPA